MKGNEIIYNGVLDWQRKLKLTESIIKNINNNNNNNNRKNEK